MSRDVVVTTFGSYYVPWCGGYDLLTVTMPRDVVVTTSGCYYASWHGGYDLLAFTMPRDVVVTTFWLLLCLIAWWLRSFGSYSVS